MKIEDAIEQEIKTAGYKRDAAKRCRVKLNNPNFPWGRDWTKEEDEEKEKRYIKEAEEHQQMAEWLEELLHFREVGTVERFKYLSKSEHNYENCHNLTCRTRCEKDGYVKGIDNFVETLNRHEQENWIDHMEYGITWSDIELVAKKLKGE